VVNQLRFESPDAKSKKLQRDLLVQGALAAQNAVKNKAPLELPQPASPPPGLEAALGADPLAGLGGGGAGGASPTGPLGMASALPPPSPAGLGAAGPLAGAAGPMPMGGAPPLPAFATGGAMLPPTAPMPGMPPTAAALGAMGPVTGEAEPRIDLPAEAPAPTVAQSPEPYDLDPGIVTADRLLDVLFRAQQGDDPNVLVTEASRPRTRLPAQNPRQVETMAEERTPLMEPPGSFVRWLAATRPEDTEGIGRELVEIYTENPDTAAELWGIVQSGLTSEEREMLPSDLLKALRGSDKATTRAGRLSLPRR